MTSEIVTTSALLPPTGGANVAKAQYDLVANTKQLMMKPDLHYGVVPGTKEPTLLKAGAEALCAAFGLVPEFSDESVIEDFDKPLFHYRRRCTLYTRDGLKVASATGACSSMESKYDHARKSEKWVYASDVRDMGLNPDDLEREERTSRKDKSKYFVYKVTGMSRIYDLINTFVKIADKRALVAAVLIATGASGFFTQDLEDIGMYHEPQAPEPPPPPATVPQLGKPAEVRKLPSEPVQQPAPAKKSKPFDRPATPLSWLENVGEVYNAILGFYEHPAHMHASLNKLQAEGKITVGMTAQQVIDAVKVYKASQGKTVTAAQAEQDAAASNAYADVVESHLAEPPYSEIPF